MTLSLRQGYDALMLLIKERHMELLVASCALFLFSSTLLAPISEALGDPQPSLLVSQALLEHKTIRLDAYEGRLAMPIDANYRLERHDGHYYYYFPLGTSFFATPAVWLANAAGLDMTVPEHNRSLQNLLASLTVVAAFLLGYGLARLYLSPPLALSLAFISVAGSSLVSTMGTALWNINLAVVFIMLGLWLVLRYERDDSRSLHPYWLGLILAAAYLTRPTTATFIAVWLGYLFWRDRPAFFRAAAVAATCFLLFLLFNQLIYGQWLSPYQSLSRLHSGDGGYARVLQGLLISPSRGFFVFHPQLFLVFLATLCLLRKGRWRPLRLALLLWAMLTIGVVSRFSHWWGGYSYGPRLLAEIVPGFFLLAILASQEATGARKGAKTRGMFGLFALLSAFAVFIHLFQGLYNQNTARWNYDLAPNVDQDSAALFDWKYPQFFASNEALCERNEVYFDDLLAQGAIRPAAFRPGDQIRHDATAERAIFIGWSPAETDFRWTACPVVRILFRTTAVEPEAAYRLVLTAGSLGGQEVTVHLNGRPLGQLRFPAQITPPVERTVTFVGSQLRPDTINEFTVLIPGARPYPGRYDRHLGLSFVSLVIQPSS